MTWKKLKLKKYSINNFSVVTTDLYEHNKGSILKINHDTSWDGVNKWVVRYFNRGSSGEYVIARPETRKEAIKIAKQSMKERPNG